MDSDLELFSDGYVAFVKEDCPTCLLIEPVLSRFAGSGQLNAIFSQDNKNFPSLDITIDDSDLRLSFQHGIETVPSLLKFKDGVEVGRIVGWLKSEWEDFCEIPELCSESFQDFSPGCGSLSVSPDLLPALEKKYGSGLGSRLVEFAAAEDEAEKMYELGWSDGLPLVPPTSERVLRMLEGTTRPSDEILAPVPPNLVDLSIEKVAINAVMAGCKPEY